jgi:hypothetical protein
VLGVLCQHHLLFLHPKNPLSILAVHWGFAISHDLTCSTLHWLQSAGITFCCPSAPSHSLRPTQYYNFGAATTSRANHQPGHQPGHQPTTSRATSRANHQPGHQPTTSRVTSRAGPTTSRAGRAGCRVWRGRACYDGGVLCVCKDASICVALERVCVHK